MEGILGKKLGMTQIFNAEGDTVPVTVVEAGPCVVVTRRTKGKDGYEETQVDAFLDRVVELMAAID